MAYQAFIILAIAASVAAQSYDSSSLNYGHSAPASAQGAPLPGYSSSSYSSLSSPLALPSSSGIYAPSAPLLAQYPAQPSNRLYGSPLQQLLYPSHGYDVTESPQEPESPPSPIPPPSAPVAFPLPNLPPQAPPPPPQQPLPDILPGTLSAVQPSQLSSHSSTSFSSPYVSYQH